MYWYNVIASLQTPTSQAYTSPSIDLFPPPYRSPGSANAAVLISPSAQDTNLVLGGNSTIQYADPQYLPIGKLDMHTWSLNVITSTFWGPTDSNDLSLVPVCTLKTIYLEILRKPVKQLCHKNAALSKLYTARLSTSL